MSEAELIFTALAELSTRHIADNEKAKGLIENKKASKVCKEVGKPIGYHQTSIQNELKRFYIWANPDTNLPRLKKEVLFSEMLEGMHYSEADLLCAAKDGVLTTLYKSITEDLVREAFPNILPPAKPKTIVDIIPVLKKEPKAKKAAVSLKD